MSPVFFEAMTSQPDVVPLGRLRVDGGASANNLLMQIQADQLGVAIERPENLETTALGVAYLAGLGRGIWKSATEVSQLNKVRTRFAAGEADDSAYDRWSAQVARMLGRG